MQIPFVPPFNGEPAIRSDAAASQRNLPPGVTAISFSGDSMLAYADEGRGAQRLGSSANAPPFPDSDVETLSQAMAAMVVRNGPGVFELNIIAVDRSGHSAAISVEQQGLGRPFIMPDPNGWPFQAEQRLYEYVNTTTSYVDQQLRTGSTKDMLYGKLLRYAMRGLQREGPHDVVSAQLVAFYTPKNVHNNEGRAPTILIVPWGPSNEAKRLAFVEGDKLGLNDPLPIRTGNDMAQEVANQAAIIRNHQQNTERTVQTIVGAPGTVKGVMCAFSRRC